MQIGQVAPQRRLTVPAVRDEGTRSATRHLLLTEGFVQPARDLRVGGFAAGLVERTWQRVTTAADKDGILGDLLTNLEGSRAPDTCDTWAMS